MMVNNHGSILLQACQALLYTALPINAILREVTPPEAHFQWIQCGSMHLERVLIVLHRFSRRAEDKT